MVADITQFLRSMLQRPDAEKKCFGITEKRDVNKTWEHFFWGS